jgi:hypothetical protein
MEMQDKAIPSSLAREFLPLEGGNVGDCFVFVTNHKHIEFYSFFSLNFGQGTSLVGLYGPCHIHHWLNQLQDAQLHAKNN